MSEILKVKGLLVLISGLSAIVLFSLPQIVRAENSAVILQYHHFGKDKPRSTSVTLEQFDQHLSYLERNHYTVWPLEKIVSYLKERRQLPHKCVAITIDDAFVSVYERGFPLLKKKGFPFTVFVPTEAIDKRYGSYMSWEQMRKMIPFGATFASHSHRHTSLIKRCSDETEEGWRERIKNDILLSIKRLKEELGHASTLFAYPYGEYDLALKEIIKSLELIGFGQQSGAIWSGSDFLVLPRFPVSGYYADMGEFITKVRSLPLPVLSAEPENPILSFEASIPKLRLKLGAGDYQLDLIACYASGQGKMQIQWVDRENKILEMMAHRPLPVGRSRYNCTAPHKDGKRYYWYSHMWIRKEDNAEEN
ncbi:MAG: polysaccharide deacetylase family protein [Thermodesulfobacteriota bacterium]|nr:polysaccharide deacetylase family protein [Thermodesulfobacteriota bacterium]